MEYGLIGEKLGHSFSKIIHETFGEYKYELKELKKSELNDFLMERNFKGINVTIPYKKDVIPYLDYVDDSVKQIGSCNVIVNRNGKLYGYNTDIDGFIGTLRYFDVSLKDKKVVILGNGGASATVQYASKIEGAREYYVISRKESDDTYSYADLYDELGDTEVIINTTPVGMFPKIHEIPAKLKHFTSLESVVDIVYNPLRTELITLADELGYKTAPGLYMLIAQAIVAIEHFLDKKIGIEKANKFYETMVHEKENIVLVGMPSSGKTTLGRLLASRIDRPFYDIDEEIIKVIGMPIKEYFSKYGEEEFRYLETQVIKTLSATTEAVISTGGGSVLRHENVRYLKQNGRLIFLDRDLENLITTDSRPLSSSKDALTNLYNSRIDIYRKVADKIIDANGSIDDTFNKLIKEADLCEF